MEEIKKRGRPPKIESEETTVEYKEILHRVRVISRFNRPDPSANVFLARDVEAELAELFKDGWKMLGQPQFTGMEQVHEVPDAGFRVMYILVR